MLKSENIREKVTNELLEKGIQTRPFFWPLHLQPALPEGFKNFENNLREMGFGDIAVNKKMKLFIRAFYGRLAQYSKSLDLQKKEKEIVRHL